MLWNISIFLSYILNIISFYKLVIFSWSSYPVSSINARVIRERTRFWVWEPVIASFWKLPTDFIRRELHDPYAYLRCFMWLNFLENYQIQKLLKHLVEEVDSTLWFPAVTDSSSGDFLMKMNTASTGWGSLPQTVILPEQRQVSGWLRRVVRRNVYMDLQGKPFPNSQLCDHRNLY